MSWNVSAGGTGEGAAEMAKTQIAHAKKFATPEALRVLDCTERVIDEFAKSYPNHTLVLDTSGHMDEHHGFANFSIKTYNNGH